MEVIDVEGLIVETLRDVASKANAKWKALVNADAKLGSEAWKKFMVLINRAMEVVSRQLLVVSQETENRELKTENRKRSLLLIYPGLLARYPPPYRNTSISIPKSFLRFHRNRFSRKVANTKRKESVQNFAP